MLKAILEGNNVAPRPGLKGARCPVCGSAVVPKCGGLVTWHFAHLSKAECDPWHEGESEWHRRWKSQVPWSQVEVTMGSHRADAVAYDGTVIEFQHSSIAYDQIRERERFYRSMVWVFDATEACESGRLKVDDYGSSRTDEFGHHRVELKWRNPRRSVASCRARAFLDLGDGELLALGELESSRQERPSQISGETLTTVILRGHGWLWKATEFIEHFFPPQAEPAPSLFDGAFS